MNWLIKNSPGLVILWAVFIAALSFTPGKFIPPIEWELLAPDTLAHIVFYGVLNFLLHLLFQKYKKVHFVYFIVTLTISITYGAMIELVQGKFIPGRYFDEYDIFSNSIGAIIGIFTYLFVRK